MGPGLSPSGLRQGMAKVAEGIAGQLLPPLPKPDRYNSLLALTPAELDSRLSVVQTAWRAHVQRQQGQADASAATAAAAAAAAAAVAAGSNDTGSPVETEGLPLEGLLPITTEVFGLSAYCNRLLFDKLLRAQRAWGTAPSAAALAASATAAAEAKQQRKRQGKQDADSSSSSDGEAGDVDAEGRRIPKGDVVYPATITVFYMGIIRHLDPVARLYFTLLPAVPALRNSANCLSPEDLRIYFQVDDVAVAYEDPETSGSDPEAVKALLLRETEERAAKAKQTGNPDSSSSSSAAAAATVSSLSLDGPEGSSSSSSAAVGDVANGVARRPRPGVPFPVSALAGTFLQRHNLRPLVNEIVLSHPGLEFLGTSPDFQTRYAQTVVARIFYTVNVAADDRLLLRELRRSNFLQKLGDLSREEDINQVHAYFSYEHFYVIYCRFWELDSDHDMLLDIRDLVKYEECALTYRTLDRIFKQAPRHFRSDQPDRMGYDDFVVFLISEVDKVRCVLLPCLPSVLSSPIGILALATVPISLPILTPYPLLPLPHHPPISLSPPRRRRPSRWTTGSSAWTSTATESSRPSRSSGSSRNSASASRHSLTTP